MSLKNAISLTGAFGQALILLGLGTLAVAPTAALANTNTVTITMTTVYMGSTRTGALIQISPAYPGMNGCTYATGDQIFIDFAAQVTPGGRDLYATVLAAYLAGRQVSFGTQGCTSEGFPIAYGVNVLP